MSTNNILSVLKCLEILRKNSGTVNDKVVLEGVKLSIDIAKTLIKDNNNNDEEYTKLLRIEQEFNQLFQRVLDKDAALNVNKKSNKTNNASSS